MYNTTLNFSGTDFESWKHVFSAVFLADVRKWVVERPLYASPPRCTLVAHWRREWLIRCLIALSKQTEHNEVGTY